MNQLATNIAALPSTLTQLRIIFPQGVVSTTGTSAIVPAAWLTKILSANSQLQILIIDDSDEATSAFSPEVQQRLAQFDRIQCLRCSPSEAPPLPPLTHTSE